MVINVKYFENLRGEKVTPLNRIDKGDWIDLRANETITLHKGDFRLIPLGVGMKLPDGYEAHIVPRSSTFKNYGIIQTNHMAIIDNSYSGNEDQWLYPVLATRDTTIQQNDRICQFRVMEKQPMIGFNTVDFLDDVSRGGFGTTGLN